MGCAELIEWVPLERQRHPERVATAEQRYYATVHCNRQCAGLYPSGRDLSGDRRLFVCFGCARMSTDLHGRPNACPAEHRQHRGHRRAVALCSAHGVCAYAVSCASRSSRSSPGAVPQLCLSRCAPIVRTARKPTQPNRRQLCPSAVPEAERNGGAVCCSQCHSVRRKASRLPHARRKDSAHGASVTVCTGWSCRRRCA